MRVDLSKFGICPISNFPYSCARQTVVHSYFTSPSPCRPLGQTLSQYLGSFDIRPQGTGLSFNQPQLTAADSVQSNFSPVEREVTKEGNATASQPNELPPEPKVTSLSDKMADTEQKATPEESDPQEEEKEYTPTLPARRSYKYDDPPIVFNDVDVCYSGEWPFPKSHTSIHLLFHSRERQLWQRSKKWS